MGFLPIKKFLEPEYLQKGKIICGIDEVGRGPWAGPLVAAALIFTKDVKIHGCADSKKLAPQQREKILKKLDKIALYGVGIVSVEEIDEYGLTRATHLAYTRALEELEQKQHGPEKKSAPPRLALALQRADPCATDHAGTGDILRPDFLVIDGRDKYQLPYPSKSIIKGDEKLKIIACASIVAKVARDSIMRSLALQYPQYGFEVHKGYGTRRHQQSLAKHGACQIHRKSFEPVRMIKK